jgi:hypothetical protein
MANRYWVGGTASWDATAGTKWALTSGGAGGQAVPTSADDVFFDATSGAVTVTLSTFQSCNNLDFTGFTGIFAASASGVNVFGNLTFSSVMGDLDPTSVFNFDATTTGKTITSNGYGPFSGFNFRGVGGGWSLSDALVATGDITVTNGTFTTNGFTLYGGSLTSNNTNTRTINLGNSTVVLVGSVDFSTTTGLTFSAGTSTISLAGSLSNLNVAAAGLTFYNFQFTAQNQATPQIFGANTFNNLSIVSRTSSGIKNFVINANQTINGTFTISGGVDATRRIFVRSNISTSVRTLTCAAVLFTDADFSAITIAGAAAPASGTRLGDCKGNTGITFGAGVTRYWNLAAGGLWSATGWASTSGGSPAANNFPLAQDTALFEATGLNSGATITLSIAYNIGTINMSARTSNTMTLATGTVSFSLYGNWVNGTGTSISGTGLIFFDGTNTAQTITSAGKTFTQAFSVTVGASGSVTLQDALTVNNAIYAGITLNSGTFNANGFNVTLSNGGMQAAAGTENRTLAIGSGTWTIVEGSGAAWNVGGTGFSVTGTGTINMAGFNSKTFTGSAVYTNITLNQGGFGTLNINGSNTFADITNTAASVSATTIRFQSGSTTTLGNFTASGQSGRQLTITRSSLAAFTLSKASGTVSVSFCTISYSNATGGATWNASTSNGNTDGGNNTGWNFAGAPITYNSSIAESSSATDVTLVAASIFAPQVSETSSATDTFLVAASTFSPQISESATATDTVLVAASIFGSQVSEAATATDDILVTVFFGSQVSETTTITDSTSVAASIFGPEISETATATDDTSVAASIFGPQVQETATATDSPLVAPSVFNVQIADSAAITDAVIGAFLWNLIDDNQSVNWVKISNQQSPSWTDIDDSPDPGWQNIPTVQ